MDISDQQLSNISVWMIHHDLSRAPRYSLPEGYTMRFYREGDVATWVHIQQSADTLFTATAETFAQHLTGDTPHLAGRVMFLVDPSGRDIGSITAWNSDALTGRDMGLVHWVAIIPQAQGRGLAKPMTCAALDVMRGLGYNEAWLETGTGRVAALNLYLHLGFQPYVHGTDDRAAWQAVAPRLKYSIKL